MGVEDVHGDEGVVPVLGDVDAVAAVDGGVGGDVCGVAYDGGAGVLLPISHDTGHYVLHQVVLADRVGFYRLAIDQILVSYA